jgi:lipopolysaccharide heptosyltransferase II
VYKIVNRKKLIATIVLDTMGRALFAIPRLFKRSGAINHGKIRSIIVIRTAYIGDVVMTLPMLQVLQNRYPDARITFLTSRAAAPLLADHPAVDEIITYDPFWFYKTSLAAWFSFIRRLRSQRFDLLIEARADIRDLALIAFFCKACYKISYAIGGGSYLLSHVVPYPGLTHKVIFHLRLAAYLGCRIDHAQPGLYVSDTARQQADKILAGHGITGDFIAAHPGSRLPLKRWPLDRCGRLYDTLTKKYNLPVVLVGSETEQDLVETVQKSMVNKSVSLAGCCGLPELAAVLCRAAVFICNDSAPMHIAAAMGTATVALFGPSSSVETGPFGKHNRVVEKDMGCRNSCDESSCKNNQYQACMQHINEDEVLAAVEILWKNP